ncbi:MAG: histidine kinase [Maribacter sp.]|uniref:2TM domain-containing protein n=1 Tax=Maribacter sp. 2307UL18-2 TaxID=3386274 RepID=UPI0039BCC693
MQRFLKHIGNALLIGILISLILLAIVYFNGTYEEGLTANDVWREVRNNMLFSIILYATNSVWYGYYTEKHRQGLFTTNKMAIAVAGHALFTLIGTAISRIILLVGIYNYTLDEFWENETLMAYWPSMLIGVVVALTFYIVSYYRHRQEIKVKEQKIIAGTASAKFDALKNQLDPHFLFNSLNVLTSLIEEDPYQAQKFTTSLSKVYRYVLEQKNKDLVTVDEELRFAKTYVRLLKMRFEDSIVFDIPERSLDPDAKIIPLSLQLLLENAVKHNVVTAEKPLHIKVTEKDGMLKVSNNLQEKQVVKKSSGVGLQNIRQRYGILTDKQVEIEKSVSDFSVKLPMLTKQVSVMETQKEYIEDKLYEKAKERVEAIKGFYGNLLAYFIVIPFLWILNYNTTSFPWAIFPTLGWGFGVVAHGMEAYGYNPLWGKRWEEKKMRELMEDEDF